jgi:hypothetical protein
MWGTFTLFSIFTEFTSAPAPDPASRYSSRHGDVNCSVKYMYQYGMRPTDCTIDQTHAQAVPSLPLSALLLHATAVGDGPSGGASEVGGLFLHIGLENGVLTRTEVRVRRQYAINACIAMWTG